MIGANKMILGLDLSLTCAGVCLMSANNCKVTSIKTKPADGSHIIRYAKIISGIIDVIGPETDLCVAIENYTFHIDPKKTSSILTLAELGGAVKVALGLFPLIVVSPGTLKLFVTGNGHAKKEDMKLAAYKKYGREFKNNDECDAFGLADLAGSAFGIWHRDFLKYETRAIATVLKGNKEVLGG